MLQRELDFLLELYLQLPGMTDFPDDSAACAMRLHPAPLPGARFLVACGSLLLAGSVAAACGGEEPACRGRATPCGSIGTAEACRLQAGCIPVSRCRGEPRPCAERPTASSCAADPACVWAPATCRGEALACESFDRRYGAEDCTRQIGCTWNATDRFCFGDAAPCGGLDATTCGTQLGCGWYRFCDGRPTACQTLETDVACAAIDGCRWDASLCTGTEAACEDLPLDLCAWQEGCRVE